MLNRIWSIALLPLVPASAHAEDAIAHGRLTHIDGPTRMVTLSSGSTYYVNKRVKISTRKVGEVVLVTFRQTSHGREAIKIRRAPMTDHPTAGGEGRNIASDVAATR